MQFQRITSSRRWIPEIDGLRFLAIGSVLLVHIFGQLVNRAPDRVHLAGHSLFVDIVLRLPRGVQLFFVISGFILAQPFVRQFQHGGERVRLGRFYLRRLTRLEPPYILSLLLYGASMVLFRHRDLPMAGLSMLSSAFYVRNFFPALPPVNLVTWSLEVEVQFYLIAPLLALLFLLRPAWLRRSLLAAAIAGTALLPVARLDAVGWWFPGQACYFLAGYLLADFGVHERSGVRHPLWDGAALVLWPLFFFLPSGPFATLVLVTLAMMAFAASLFGPFTRRLLSLRPVALLGGMCYSLYLMHMLIISALFPLTRRWITGTDLLWDFAGQLALLLPPVVIGSALYYLFIERPCMKPNWPSDLRRAIRSRMDRPSIQPASTAVSESSG